jgi:hypothetical protein
MEGEESKVKIEGEAKGLRRDSHHVAADSDAINQSA